MGLDRDRRARYRELAGRHQTGCHVVTFDTPDDLCRARNKARTDPVPAKAMAGQLAAWAEARAAVDTEGFDAVHIAGPVEIVPVQMLAARHFATSQKEEPVPLRFGLQILAGQTSSIRLGTLVTGVTYRNLGHLAKIVATLDVLSQGRAVCGVGAAWFEREHRLYGWDFPPVKVRYDLLEDALALLPLMWGAGSPPFSGRTTAVAQTVCYPRPCQQHIPILIGGSGERRTLRLVARYADACNLFGDPATVTRKLEVLGRHCTTEGRPRASIKVTHLSTALVGRSRAEVDHAVDGLRPRATSPEVFASAVNAGTVEDHIGRFRQLADAGVQTAIVNLADLGPAVLDGMAEVVAAFKPSGADGPAGW